MSNTTSSPIEREVSQESCGRGPCEGSLALTSGDRGLNEGTTYIVSVSASNRYGQSQESGNSDPFSFTKSGMVYLLLPGYRTCF